MCSQEHSTNQSLLEQKQQLLREQEQNNDQVGDLPKTQQEVLRLARDVEVSEEIYDRRTNARDSLIALTHKFGSDCYLNA